MPELSQNSFLDNPKNFWREFLEKLLAGKLFDRLRFLEKTIPVPGGTTVRRAYRLFSLTERIIFMILSVVMVISAVILIFRVNGALLAGVPAHGGTLVEGIVGTPRFINPVLAITDADKDLTALVFSGLLRAKPDGTYENLLAYSFEIFADDKTYFVHIKKDAYFHDDSPVTADDIIFTINRIKDPNIKSPQRPNWEGVDVEKTDDYGVTFRLSAPYAPFLENLTIGILPKRVWEKVQTDEFQWCDLNLDAVGAGPNDVREVLRNPGGIPSEINLRAFPNFVGGEPYITKIKTLFYNNEEKAVSALLSGDVDSLGGISPETAESLIKRDFNIETATLPRIFALFFNQNQNKIFADKNVRKALALAAPRETIVSLGLKGFAIAVNDPLPIEDKGSISYDGRLKEAGKLLDSAGYKMASGTPYRVKITGKGKTQVATKLAFSIATADTSDLKAVAEKLAESYKNLGFNVSLNIFETGDLQQNVIRERKYETLLFGEVVGRERDLFPFWHSSERLDPGLNIALYTNSKVDKMLDNLRKTSNTSKQQEILASLLFEFKLDAPAVFLYAPKYIYAIPKRVKRVILQNVNSGNERFLAVSDWYIETDTVWKLFVR